MKTQMYQSVNDPKQVRINKKPPGFLTEAAFCSVTLVLVKMYSDATYDAISFVTVLLPIMVYFVLSIVMQIFKFIQKLHMEEMEDDDGILSPKQIKILIGVLRNMAAYFGIYTLSGQLDKHVI